MPAVDPGANLAATLPVWALAGGSVTAYSRATDRFRMAAGLEPLDAVPDPGRIAAAFASERLFRENGAAPDVFAPLSGFFTTADGWIRTHANYPHHRTRLLAALGLPSGTSREEFTKHVAALSASDIEDRAHEHGAIAVRVRTEHEWAASPQGRAAAAGPLVAIEPREDRRTGGGSFPDVSRSAADTTNPRRPAGSGDEMSSHGAQNLGGGDITAGGSSPGPGANRRSQATLETWFAPTSLQPLRGVRVVDMTRVIAGPVATRALALLGAEVVRIDPPGLPEIEWQYRDTCQGKRTTLLDIRTEWPLFRDLLENADVLISGYRPGALLRAGVDAGQIDPGIVYGRVCAWGEHGPWGDRRGFDSIVQAASGISLIEGAQGDSRSEASVGALPAQALDHASGYLLAAGVLDALVARGHDGIGRDVRVALARTASWLLAAPGRTPEHPPAALPDARYAVTHDGITTAGPALPAYPDYPFPAPKYGANPAAWTA
ncbi:CoA transferase [Nocardia yamanashiensis]|uniref:CoA transferase n=1 Tax=Nocardia yamanashiensis TaxID=209247 RepID=UPI001E58AB5E|nr:CoA transferase [Nocardia yamanashiensis]UGT45644.1 CoA transferase [Nocardia yamanashiensis]